MKIICDIGVIRGTSYDVLNELKDSLHVPRMAIDEILTTSDISDPESIIRVEHALKKIQLLDKEYSLKTLLPEEVILSASGIHSLPPLPSATYMENNISAVLNNENGSNNEVIRMLINQAKRAENWEVNFGEVIKVFIQKIGADLVDYKVDSAIPFYALELPIQQIFIKYSEAYWEYRTMLFVEKLHQRDYLTILNGKSLSYGYNHLIIDVWAAYLYYRYVTGSASTNDQFDLKYFVYLFEGDMLWTRDKMPRKIISEHLNRSEILFEYP
ncbi:MAG: hypothetical protein KA536_06495 [Saprospiraceae bacterium]|nr:hypothetical protein [Saprospiraceae bacterium]